MARSRWTHNDSMHERFHDWFGAPAPRWKHPALAVPCPECQAKAGVPCTSAAGSRLHAHTARLRAAYARPR